MLKEQPAPPVRPVQPDPPVQPDLPEPMARPFSTELALRQRAWAPWGTSISTPRPRPSTDPRLRVDGVTQLLSRLVPPVLPVPPVRPEPLDLLVPKVQRALPVRPETLAPLALLVPPDLLALTG